MQRRGCLGIAKRSQTQRLTDASQLRAALQEPSLPCLSRWAASRYGYEQAFYHYAGWRERRGKTTSIGKLAHYFQLQRKTVLLAAGDTFRAAAREQLMAGASATMSPLSRRRIAASKRAIRAVIFDAVNAAKHAV